MQQSALLALEDGSIFLGYSIGVQGVSVGEVVFNTAMTGYQEVLSDPSYCRQIITLTYPHIGNTGMNAEDDESDQVYASGLVIREYSPIVSSWRAEISLTEYCEKNNVVAIAGIDTRRLTRILRDKGAQKGCITTNTADVDAAIASARNFAGLSGMDLAKVVSTKRPYAWTEESQLFHPDAYHVVVMDFGVKRNILRMLAARGARVTVVPAETTADEILAMQPDGVCLSNGPGDPEPCSYAIETIQKLIAEKIPLFGICLGHQLLALAVGAKTVKMKFGHHGANHPVQDLRTERVMITSQNHGFAVDESTLPSYVVPTHRSLFDGTLQGMQFTNAPVYSFQGHPEACPGPEDASHLFMPFFVNMRKP
jgi:carbamoyl-phosphate synthase small subunit